MFGLAMMLAGVAGIFRAVSKRYLG